MGSTGSVFRNISVVVSLHFVIEDLSFGVVGLFKELGVNKLDDFVAIFVKLSNNLSFVASEESEVLGTFLFLFLLNRAKSSPGSSS